MTDKPRFATPEWYRGQARRFTNLAAMAVLPEVKTQLMTIVREYEALAREAEKTSPSK
jgi:hypothetical protein